MLLMEQKEKKIWKRRLNTLSNNLKAIFEDYYLMTHDIYPAIILMGLCQKFIKIYSSFLKLLMDVKCNLKSIWLKQRVM